MKKVLVLYQSDSVVCGIGNWIDSFNEQLSQRGWEVQVGLAWGGKYHDPRNIEKARPHWKTTRMNARTGTEEGRIQAVEKVISRRRANIVILNCLNSAFEAVRRLRWQGADFKLIAINHGNFAKQAGCLIQHRDIIDLAVCVGRLSYLVMSQHPRGFSTERVKHVPNCVPIPSCQNDWHTRCRRIGYAGRLDGEKRKRISDLIPYYEKVNKLFPKAEFWIAGDGDQMENLRKLTAYYPEQVKFFGRLSRTELYEKFYPHIDVLTHFSDNEGWGLAIAEAMAHGVVPVVAAFKGIHLEGLVMKDRNALIFPVGDTNEAARLTAILFEQPDERTRLARQAAQDVRQKYNPEKFGESWDETLNYCLSLPALPKTLTEPESLRQIGRWGFKERQWETIRRLLRRRVRHQSAGEEWPHFICQDQELIQTIEAVMNGAESTN